MDKKRSHATEPETETMPGSIFEDNYKVSDEVEDGVIQDEIQINANKKIALLILSLSSAHLMSGMVFGISALKDTLIYKEGAFSNYCDEIETAPCTSQLQMLTLTFTLATSSVSVSSFFSGLLLDHCGPRISASLWSLVFAIGLASLAVAKYLTDALYVAGFCALGIAGPAVFASMTNFADAYPNKEDVIISAQSGLLQTSSVMVEFIVYLIDGSGFTLQQVLLGYTLVPLGILVASLILCPDMPFGSAKGANYGGEPHRLYLIRSSLPDNYAKNLEQPQTIEAYDGEDSCNVVEVPLLVASGRKKPPELFNVNVWTQIRSTPFFVIAGFTAFFIFVINFYIVTIEDQLYKEFLMAGLDDLYAEALASDYTSLFNLVLPVGSAAAIPVSSWLLYSKGLPSTFAISGVLNAIFLTFALPNFLPYRYKVVGFFVFAFNRSLMFASITDYLAEVFGFGNYGRVFGLAMLFGSTEIPLQYICEIVAEAAMNRYVWLNLLQLVLGLGIGLALPYYLVAYLFSGFFFRPKLKETESNLASKNETTT